MSRIRLRSILALLFAFGSACAAQAIAAGGEPVRVSADDLAEGKVIVVGRLGIPLQTVATIKGVWKSPDRLAKDSGLLFHVTHIDGNELPQPIVFHRAIVEVTDKLRERRAQRLEPEAGAVWEFRGYETGAYWGTPHQLEEELELPLAGAPVWSRRFLTELKGVMPRSGLFPKKATQ